MKALVLQNEECEPLGSFSEEIDRRKIEYSYGRLFEEDAPKDLEGFSHLIIMGGPMNVYQEAEYPFLRNEDQLIKEALKKGLPTLGVCLGAQLIAKAAGAKVRKGRAKEIGWHNIRITKEGKGDRLFRMFDDEFMVFQWHGDTFDLPKDAVPLSENNLYLQAFRINNAYALQFHLEVTEEMIKDWLGKYEGEVRSEKGIINPEYILRDTEKHIAGLNQCAKEFIRRWIT